MLLIVLTGCAANSAMSPSVQHTADAGLAPALKTADPSLTNPANSSKLFTIDTLVRSRQLANVDMHVRYVERTDAGLTIHLAFYNNGTSDLLSVQGIDVRNARLVGDMAEMPTAWSQSFANGIMPADGWAAGGASNGTLTFADAKGTSFSLEMPGFPTVTFRLTLPLRAAPEPVSAASISYTSDFVVTSDTVAGLRLRIEDVSLAMDGLALRVALEHSGGQPANIPAAAGTLMFDSRWNQYRPLEIDPALLGRSDALSIEGVLHFARPTAGDVVLLRYPSFPLLRIPLRDGDTPTLAALQDRPPSVEPLRISVRPTVSPSEQADFDPDVILAELTQRLKSGDRDGYLAVFAPEMREAQGEVFDRMQTLPLEEITLTTRVDASRVGPEQPTLDGDDIRGYHALWSYRVKDVDPANIFTSDVEIDFRRSNDSWQITAIGGVQPFWALGPTLAQRTGAFWIFYRPAFQAELPLMEQEAAAALDKIATALPDRVASLNVMFVTADPEEFKALTGRDPARFLGVALSRYEIHTNELAISSAAFYINGSAFSSDPAQNRQQTITHELTHLTLAQETMPYTPLWAVEGVAMQVSDDLPEETMRSLYLGGDLRKWNLRDFTAKRNYGGAEVSEQQTATDYAYAAYLVRYLTLTYGFDRFMVFYDSFADIPFDSVQGAFAGEQSHSSLDDTLGSLAASLSDAQTMAAFDVDLAIIDSHFKSWLSDQIH